MKAWQAGRAANQLGGEAEFRAWVTLVEGPRQVLNPVTKGAYGGPSETTGKNRRTPSPAAERSHRRLAGHADSGWLGSLHREHEVEEADPGWPYVWTEGAELDVPVADHAEEGRRKARKRLTRRK